MTPVNPNVACISDELVNALAQQRIQSGGGLVEQHNLGFHGQGAGQSGAFFMPPLTRLDTCSPYPQARPGLIAASALSDLAFRHLGFLAQRESDIVIEGHGVEQGGALKEDAKFLSDFIEFALAQLGNIFSIHQHAAAIREEEGVQML